MIIGKLVSTSSETPQLPLGIRVFDLTHVWSGPMDTRVLASLGAEVLKIENLARPDSLRRNGADLRLRYPDGEYGDDPYNCNAWSTRRTSTSAASQLTTSRMRGAAKDLIDEHVGQPRIEQHVRTARTLGQIASRADIQVGIAAFRGKRTPNLRGH